MYWTNTWFSVLFNVFSEIRLPSGIWQHRKKKPFLGLWFLYDLGHFLSKKLDQILLILYLQAGNGNLQLPPFDCWNLSINPKIEFRLRPETHKLPINAGVQNYLWGLQMVVYGSFRALAYIQAIYMLLRLSRLFYEYLLSFCATETVGRALSSCVTLCFVLNG